MYLYLYGAGCNDFVNVENSFRNLKQKSIHLSGGNLLPGPLEGVDDENLTFFGPNSVSGPKKVLIFKAHPFQWPSK
jgi:hypothetical protein